MVSSSVRRTEVLVIPVTICIWPILLSSVSILDIIEMVCQGSNHPNLPRNGQDTLLSETHLQDSFIPAYQEIRCQDKVTHWFIWHSSPALYEGYSTVYLPRMTVPTPIGVLRGFPLS